MKEPAYAPSGHFSWPKRVTTDSEGATRFHAALFNREAVDLDRPTGSYTSFRLDDLDGAAAYQAGPDQVAPSHWKVYVAVCSADKSAAKAAADPRSCRAGVRDHQVAGELRLFAGLGRKKCDCRPGGSGWTRDAILCVSLLGILQFWRSVLGAAPVPVRFTEGTVRGFLVLTDTGGGRIASGDFSQVSGAGEIQTHTVFHFKDGSEQGETVVFTQKPTFVLKSYHLVQKGPAFRDDMDVMLVRATGHYLVKTKAHKDGQEKVVEGRIDLPLDVYNGMIPVVTKNLVKGAKETVHMVGFTPKPRVIGLEINPSGEEKLQIGDLKKTALHYVLKPKLGLLEIPATLFGRMPPDNHIWILAGDAPAFVKFEGPLSVEGPIWRIELTSPIWPK